MDVEPNHKKKTALRILLKFFIIWLIWFCAAYWLNQRSLLWSIIEATLFALILETYHYFAQRERYTLYGKKELKKELIDKIYSLGYEPSKSKETLTIFTKKVERGRWWHRGRHTIRLTDNPFYVKIECRESLSAHFEPYLTNKTK